MSRIVALVHSDGRPVEISVLQKMSGTLSHRGHDGEQFWVRGSTGLACQHLRVTAESTGDLQPFGCPPELAISFDGRLDNRNELLTNCGAGLKDEVEPSDSAIVLAAYREWGEKFAEHLNGDFAVAIIDSSQQKLLLARDIMGIRPLYYWQSRQTFLAASEIKAILAQPEVQVTPDDDALADFIFGGDAYEVHRTCFRNVYRVPPGRTVVVQRGQVRLFQHWDFNPAKQIRYSSIPEYADALRALFEQAVRRRLRSSYPVAVLVSGGLDSSAILCEAAILRQAGAPVAPAMGVSMIFPDDTPADEKQFLADIEAKCKLQIRRLPFSSFRFEEGVVWDTELPRLQWNSTGALLGAASSMGCRVLLDGYFGDQTLFSDAHILDLAWSLRWIALNREFAALIQSMKDVEPSVLKRYYWNAALRAHIPRGLMPLARRARRLLGRDQYPGWYNESFRIRAFERSVGSQLPNRFFASTQSKLCYCSVCSAYRLNIVEESRKMSAAHGLEPAYPFMDKDLIEFMMAIPAQIVQWQGVAKGLFRQAMRGILPEGIRRRDWKADFTLLNSEAVASDYQKYQECLEPDCFAVKYGYLDPFRLQADFPQYRSQLSAEMTLPASRVTGTVALEFWLRRFFPEIS